MTMGRRSDAANRPGDHAKQSGHQREAAAQLPILALLDQGPGSARPRGACPRYAAGSAAPPMGYSRSLLPRSNFQTSVATQSLNSTNPICALQQVESVYLGEVRPSPPSPLRAYL
jgi:hypothetical protein